MTAAAAPPAPALPARRSALRSAGRFASGLILLLAAMALVAVVAASFAGIRLRVEHTGSMAPALQPGDLVLLRETPLAAVHRGDVIGVRNDTGRVIVHRVQRIEPIGSGLTVTTQGDANPTSEQWSLRPSADVALVQGRVPELGGLVQGLRGPVPALLVLLAATLLALSLLRSIWSRS